MTTPIHISEWNVGCGLNSRVFLVGPALLLFDKLLGEVVKISMSCFVVGVIVLHGFCILYWKSTYTNPINLRCGSVSLLCLCGWWSQDVLPRRLGRYLVLFYCCVWGILTILNFSVYFVSSISFLSPKLSLITIFWWHFNFFIYLFFIFCTFFCFSVVSRVSQHHHPQVR